jgi:hypothetical protein
MQQRRRYGYGYGRNVGFNEIPLELLDQIDDSLPINCLRHVNKKMRYSVQNPCGPYKGSYIVTEANIGQIKAEFDPNGSIMLRASQTPRKSLNVHLIFQSFPPGLRAKLQGLYTNMKLGLDRNALTGGIRTLDITLLKADVQGEAAAIVLADTFGDILYHSFKRVLETLKLDCSSLSLGPEDCSSAFKNMTLFAPNLHTVSLELSHNHIGDAGCRDLLIGLSQRGENIRKLYLGLMNNQIGPRGAFWLSKFKQLDLLESLQIDLEDNRIGDIGVGWLSHGQWYSFISSKDGLDIDEEVFDTVLWSNHPQLQTLHFNFKNNEIGDKGAKWFSHGQPTFLRHLYVNFDQNVIGIEGLRDISNWNLWEGVRLDEDEDAIVRLESLHIHARNNPGTERFRSEVPKRLWL